MPKAKGKSERVFQSEIRQSLRTLPGPKHYFKIPDSGFICPYDAYLVYCRKFYALEYKISKNTISIPWVNLFSGREHELLELKKAREAGAGALILINIFNPRKWNYVLAMDVAQYEFIKSFISPKKSIKLDDPMLKEVTWLEKDSEGLWPLYEIL